MNVFEKVLIHHGASTIDTTINVKPIENSKWVKPDCGFWASPELEDHISVWTKWCEDECYKHNSSTEYLKFMFNANARVYVVNGLDDLEYLLRTYTGNHSCVNWLTFSNDYDALYLTDEGQWSTRLTVPNLYGWDMESCVIFNYDAIKLL